MKPMRPRPPLESAIVERIRKALFAASWTIVDKTHGGEFQSGIPDLITFRPGRGVQFVEIKRPKGGRLTPAQKSRFARWEASGLGVWVLTGPDDIGLLDGPANWRDFLPPAC